MSDRIKLDNYKQQIADLYTRRSPNYDAGEWHPRIAHRLVEYAQLQSGQQILDIATGTGMVAIESAQIVGERGRVIGIDISTGMLDRARSKVTELGLTNIEFQLADAEAIDFPANSFDWIFCSSALIWMSDLSAVLKLWYRSLKPGGWLGFHAFAETAFVGGVVSQQVLEKYGVSLLLNQPTGTPKKCQDLLAAAGFETIDIKVEPDGSYISLEQAKGMWSGNNLFPVPGQFLHPLSQLSAERLAQAKIEFDTEIEALQTDRGVWSDSTIFYTFGRKLA
jgi:ubiquinone/menaquinone biosynthesis C-methylase UbiE